MNEDDFQQDPGPEKRAKPWGYVYILRHPKGPDRVKIGFTQTIPTARRNAKGPKNRVEHLNFVLEAFGLGAVEVVGWLKHDYAECIEKMLHLEFERITTDVGSSKEMFKVAPEVAKARMEELAGLGEDHWEKWMRGKAGHKRTRLKQTQASP